METTTEINILLYKQGIYLEETGGLISSTNFLYNNFTVFLKTIDHLVAKDIATAQILSCNLEDFLEDFEPIQKFIQKNPKTRLFIGGHELDDLLLLRDVEVAYLFFIPENSGLLDFRALVSTYLAIISIQELKFNKYADSPIDTSVFLN